MKTIKAIIVITILICLCKTVVAQTSQITYGQDHLSGKLDISGVDYATSNVYTWTFDIPQNQSVQITRVNNCYMPTTTCIEILLNNQTPILSQPSIGEFTQTVTSTNGKVTVKMTSPGLETEKETVATIKFAQITTSNSSTVVYEGDVQLNAGTLRAYGQEKYLGSKVAAVLGKDYASYTCFGAINGGRIRGSNEGYLIIEGNPNGYGDKTLYLNTYTSNANILMTSPGGRVGIGISKPAEKLHIGGAIRGNGTGGALKIKTEFGQVEVGAQNNTGIHFTTTLPKFIFNQNMDIKGVLRAAEIKVESIDKFADFVFEKDYQLPSLKETSEFIKANGHLPGIPSAIEVKENGMDLVEMQVKLLQKIEELTLHVIELQNVVEQQNSKIQQLENTQK
ncbi:hypothetical protein NE451_14870 [Bacteroides nordii]|uniref:hypothetical protein n=1 Tax=Bacteroides TaxID=816 RepID=UPI0003623BA7|nr:MULTISPECIES: hypothetical protein [Bacteroides]EOA59877.1 hypothetical protein HMPREF1214_00919 [Bacteroides sp. HPS0048]MCQ4915775.1 hypothetical protein [Bacteroides nordii]